MKIKMTKMDEDENDNQETDKSNFERLALLKY